jgi:Mrp family chromosome partitioning ATPase
MIDPLLVAEAKHILMGTQFLRGQREGGFSLAVTSSVAGEGKTSVSSVLALTLASELDVKCLLVEANWERPSLGSRLGTEQPPSTQEYLSDPEACIKETKISNLHLLPAPRTEEAEPGVGNAEVWLHRLLKQSNTNYGATIYDCSEVLNRGRALLDPLVPASLATRLILVYLANATRKQDALKSKYILENVNGDIGIVVNNYRNDFYLR